MNVLRVITYILTSIASLLFILLVVVGYLQLNALADRLQNTFPGSSTPSVSQPPPGTSSGEEQFCYFNPDDPLCAN